MEGGGKMIEENHFVLFDDAEGELWAYVFDDVEHNKDAFRTIQVPPELAQSIHDWVEKIAPGICLEPHEIAPDCLFKAVKKSEV
jgi:hypothetical protein